LRETECRWRMWWADCAVFSEVLEHINPILR